MEFVMLPLILAEKNRLFKFDTKFCNGLRLDVESVAILGDGDAGEVHGAELFPGLVTKVGGDDFEVRI